MGRARLMLLLALCGTCRGTGAVPDSAHGIPLVQQRVVTQADFGADWPFEPAAGTLACIAGAVVFRAQGVDYALNEAAKSRGYALPGPLVRMQRSRPPTNPLPGVRQDQRQKIFSASMQCDREAVRTGTDASACKQRLRDAMKLSGSDLRQIEAEGQERVWPPVPPRRQSVQPIVEAGSHLCRN
jgi:hypothetical protein